MADFSRWPRLTELCQQAHIGGFAEDRREAMISCRIEELFHRMSAYFDPSRSWEQVRPLLGGLGDDAGGEPAEATRARLLADGAVFAPSNLRRYALFPLDQRWCYHTAELPLWREPRPELLRQLWSPNRLLVTRAASGQPLKGCSLWLVGALPDLRLLDPDVVAIPLRWRSEVMGQAAVKANLSEAARLYLAGVGLFEPDNDEETATMLWHHALAISFSPAWMEENGPAIGEDFLRVPLPVSRAVLKRSAALGRLLADLVDPDIAVSGVTAGKLRAELKPLGELRRVSGSVDPAAGDLAVENRWGNLQRETVVMPGPGKTTEVFDAALSRHALGPKMLDIWLNDRVFLHAVPEAVWDFTVGGYQVIKKWLSHREQAILGRDLTLDEARHLSAMVRRIAAILLLSDKLDGVYRASRDASVPWASLVGSV